MKNHTPQDIVMPLDTQSYFDLRQLPYPATRGAALARLAQEQLIVASEENAWNITNLGALLFAKDLRQFAQLQRKAPRVIIYKGSNKLETVREQIGVKGYSVGFERPVDYINIGG